MALESTPALTGAEALQRLKEGNARFISGKPWGPIVQGDVLAKLALRQQPYVTVIGCSDSRVPPEVLFDAGLGELFVIRVAGNVLGAEVAGTLQYAATQLHTPLFVILGHENCGAVEAAIAQKFHGATHRSRIAHLLTHIEPALEGLDPDMPADALLCAGVEANVRRAMAELLSTTEAAERVRLGEWKLVGAVCEIRNGFVRFLE